MNTRLLIWIFDGGLLGILVKLMFLFFVPGGCFGAGYED